MTLFLPLWLLLLGLALYPFDGPIQTQVAYPPRPGLDMDSCLQKGIGMPVDNGITTHYRDY